MKSLKDLIYCGRCDRRFPADTFKGYICKKRVSDSTIEEHLEKMCPNCGTVASSIYLGPSHMIK